MRIVKTMRANIYFSKVGKEKADRLAAYLGLPLSRLFAYLIEYYVRKEKIKITDLEPSTDK